MPADQNPALAATVRMPKPTRRRGPKPKLESEKRTHQVNCRLTDDEWLELNLRRGALAPAEALRIWALSRPLPRAIPELNLQAYSYLVRAANNLNQLARHKNVRGLLDLTELAAKLATKLADFRASLLGVFGKYQEEWSAQFEPDLDTMPSRKKGET
jgi:hypothetical protein